MTVELAIIALRNAGMTDVSFQHGNVNFVCKGKLCSIRTNHYALVKADDVAWWATRAKEA